MTNDEFALVEELVMQKPGRVKEDGQKTAKACKKGDIVKVSGNDKVQLLSTGMAKRKTAK